MQKHADRWRLFTLASIPLILDQVSKDWAQKYGVLWESSKNLGRYLGKNEIFWSWGAPSAMWQKSLEAYLALGFHYVRNPGAAWGLFAHWEAAYRVPFFYTVGAVAIGTIFHYLHVTPVNEKISRSAFALILSGALGNLCDRLRWGYVIDFLDVHWHIPLPWGGSWAYYFPKFNIADSMISLGVLCLFLDSLVQKKSLTIKEKSAANFTQ